MRKVALGLVVLAGPMPAFAHELIAQHGAFFGPALHIFTEIDHLAAFAVLGLLAGQHNGRARAAGVVAFLVAVTLGMAAALTFASLGAFESVERLSSAVSVLVVGVLVAAAISLPVWQIALVSAALGAMHGIANGFALATSPQPMVALLGASSAACVIALTGALAATLLGGQRGRIAVRVVGSWLAALGLLSIGLALRA